jgi:DNA repair exonuclease SbcCD ATPase subunit
MSDIRKLRNKIAQTEQEARQLEKQTTALRSDMEREQKKYDQLLAQCEDYRKRAKECVARSQGGMFVQLLDNDPTVKLEAKTEEHEAFKKETLASIAALESKRTEALALCEQLKSELDQAELSAVEARAQAFPTQVQAIKFAQADVNAAQSVVSEMQEELNQADALVSKREAEFAAEDGPKTAKALKDAWDNQRLAQLRHKNAVTKLDAAKASLAGAELALAKAEFEVARYAGSLEGFNQVAGADIELAADLEIQRDAVIARIREAHGEMLQSAKTARQLAPAAGIDPETVRNGATVSIFGDPVADAVKRAVEARTSKVQAA